MSEDHTALCTGQPRFADKQLADMADSGQPVAAWASALQGDPIAAVAAVKGPFAVGLRRADGTALLAVDRFACETLCYRVVDGQLSFATRADDVALAGAEIDPQAIYEYLLFHAIPSPRTIFKGVFRLPPGHLATFAHGRLTVARYWTPQFHEDADASFGQLREEFLHLLRDAVRRQLHGGLPACFLSGGTDSSTVAGLIAEVSGQPPETYSIGFEAAGYDEMAYARIASKRFRTRHHEYYVTPDDLVRSISQVAASFDQPFGNSSAVPTYHCALQARDGGVTRLLAGDGGDELFGGNSRYAKQRVFDLYEAIPNGLRRGLLEPLFATQAAARLPFLRKGVSYIEQARVPMPDRLQMYNLLLRLGPDNVATPGLLSLVDRQAPVRQQREVWAAPQQTSQLNRTLAYDWRFTLAESDLPKVRGAVELAGIGVGFPLLDDELLAFSMRLRDSYKLRGLKLRWFFKEALRGFLPEQIITKSKHGFGLPFGVWLVQHQPLRALATDSLRSLSSRGIVKPDFIAQLLDQRLAEHPGYYGEMVWILMALEQWLQRHSPDYAVR